MAGLIDTFYKWAFLSLFALSFGTYFVHHLILSLWYKTQNLKKRYPNAQWALVTGSSSGDDCPVPMSSDLNPETFVDVLQVLGSPSR